MYSYRQLWILAIAAMASGEAAKLKPRSNDLLWRDPGRVEALDFARGPGGVMPAPPYTFIKEEGEGAYPKVLVRDGRGRMWSVKWGREVHSEPFAARVAWASGYFVEPVHYVPRGVIRGARDLKRAGKHIDSQGRFEEARFQLRDPRTQFSERYNWSWTYNPFQGTKEMNGLKVVMLLLSNWDNKDARDQDKGVNTAIFVRRNTGRHYIYTFSDWGATMGRWGGVLRRSSWDCEGFRDDTSDFVKVDDGKLEWGYRGVHDGDFLKDIRVSDVKWVLRYAGRIQDRQFMEGLRASGATRAEAECFTRELRRRINQLRRLTSAVRPVRSASASVR